MRSKQSAPEDREVIAASFGDPEAFAVLFDRYYVTMHRFLARRCGPVGADDLAGEVFRIAFERRRSFDLERPTARPWLYGIATNVLRDHRRREARRLRALQRAASADAVALAPIDPAAEVDDQLIAAARRAVLLGALASIPDADRDALVLNGVEGLTYDEVAAVLEIPIGTVRSRIYRARRRLRELIEATGQQRGDRPPTEVRHER